MIFLGIAIPIGILLGLLLFFSGLYNRNRLAAAASGGLDMFTTNFENQLDSVENYLLNLSLNDATFRSLSEQTDRTRAYLDAYEIAQGFPAVLAANDTLMGVVLRSGSGNLYVGRYGAAAQQLKQKLNLEAYLGQPGQTNKMMTKGWYLRTIGQRLYLLRSVFYQKASLTAAVDLRLVFEELVEDYGLDGQVIVMNDSGNVLVGDANLLPTKMEWNSEGYCLTKVGRDSRLVVRKQVKTLTVLYLVPYQHFGVDFAPYQILLVMGAVFVLLAIPFLLFYMKQEIFAPMTALVSTMDRIGRGELSVRSSVDYRNAEFTQVNETFNRMIDQITQLKIDGYEKELEARRNEMTALKLQIRPHFVLNCLKSVYAMVQTGSREDAQQLILLSTAVGNMSSEVFTPLQVLSVTVAIPAEQCLVLVLQSRVGEPLEADYITRQLNYLQSACAQYIHCEAAFYPEGPQPFEQASEIYQKLLQQRSENVALKGGVLLGRPAEKAPEVFRIPQIGAWQKLLQAGCAQAMEQEACQLLDKLTANNQLNSQTLRYFYQDFMQMLFSLPEKKRQDDMFREPEALELYRNGMKTVPDMKALVHYVASVWDSETEENSQSTVEIIMAYIAEHLENELRREELAEAVHLNPDYMARLFKKETGMNLKDYIIQQKMQEAQSLLCTTNLPISLIAAKVGYTNFGHFSTSYKKFYHKTPQEERSAAL